MSILSQLKDLHQKVDAMTPSGTSSSTKTQPENAIISVKNKIDQSKEAKVAETLGKYTQGFLEGCPSFEPGDLSSIGRIIEYSVDYVEKVYPKIALLLSIAKADSSPFKLQTCIIFVTLIIPPMVELAEDAIKGFINTVVDLKNRLEQKSLENYLAVTPTKKKKKWFSLK